MNPHHYKQQINLGLAVLAIYLTFSFYFHFFPSLEFKSSVGILTDISFLNLTHIGFTFIAFLCFQNWRLWLRNVFIHNRLLVFFSFVIIAIFLVFYLLIPASNIYWNLSRFFLRSYGLHHSVMQSYGLLVLYGGNKTIYKLKKFFYSQTLIFTLVLFKYFFPQFFLNSDFLIFIFFCSLLSTIMIVLLLRANRDNLYFALRLFIYPLSLLSPIFGMAISAIHGIEYSFLIKNYNDNVGDLQKLKLRTSLGLFLLFLIFILACILNIKETPFALINYHPWNAKNPIFLLLFWALMDSLNALHYLFDSQLFKVKNPLTSKLIIQPLCTLPRN